MNPCHRSRGPFFLFELKRGPTVRSPEGPWGDWTVSFFPLSRRTKETTAGTDALTFLLTLAAVYKEIIIKEVGGGSQERV